MNQTQLTEQTLRETLAGEYRKQINNFFANEQKALEFLSNVVASVQRTPALLNCTQETVINSFMTMASLKLMPSGVSGEAYVIPYKNRGIMEAQFQLGYQGIVTLLYRAGNKEVVAEIVRKEDVFTIKNGKISHEVDPFKTSAQRGDIIGAYAIITTAQGGTVEKFMHIDDIHAHAKKFSKSFSSSFSPWNKEQDPEGWMPRKTVLKQAAKLAPKNETLHRAIAEDNKESTLHDRLEGAQEESKNLTMGQLLDNNDTTHGDDKKAKSKKAKGAKKATADTNPSTAPCNENGEVIGDVELPA